jgi:hypothetical protein
MRITGACDSDGIVTNPKDLQMPSRQNAAGGHACRTQAGSSDYLRLGEFGLGSVQLVVPPVLATLRVAANCPAQ